MHIHIFYSNSSGFEYESSYAYTTYSFDRITGSDSESIYSHKYIFNSEADSVKDSESNLAHKYGFDSNSGSKSGYVSESDPFSI